jgi:4-hydroxy-tetrahydrodipicolinate synthase
MSVSGIRLWTAMVTPFDESGAVDMPAFAKTVEHQIEGGVKGLLLFGSTGEAATLSDNEKKEISEQATKLKSDALVMTGITHNDTRVAVERAKQAASWGADCLLVAPPYYNRPSVEGLRRHFAAINEATDLPIILYNIPFRVSVKMEIELIRELAELKNIVGLKEASADVAMASRLHGDGKLTIWSGDDSILLSFMSVGAVGGISVTSNLFPAEFTQMVKDFSEGRQEEAEDRASLFAEWYPRVFAESNPIGIKAAMSLKGLLKNEFRLPMCPMSSGHMQELEKFLASFPLSCAKGA